MRRQIQNDSTQVQVGLFAACLVLVALILPGGDSAGAATPTVELAPAPSSAALRAAADGPAGPRGPIGPAGPRGPRGTDSNVVGPVGPAGPRGLAGPDAPAEVKKQFVNVGWQNGDFGGYAQQSFTAPGIGYGYVRCTPPRADNQYTGDQLIRFFPLYNTAGTPDDVKPQKWATTMWTARHGGNEDNGNARYDTVVRTARLDRGNQPDFYESFSTAPALQYDPESTGSMRGMITTEPWNEGTRQPAATTFELSWHWNFRNSGQERCFVNGTFITDAK